MIDLSIVGVNWNVRDLLEACLQSIQQHIGLDPDRYEVHVIDNHSSDDSAAMVRERFPQFRLTENQVNKGFGRANNQGRLLDLVPCGFAFDAFRFYCFICTRAL